MAGWMTGLISAGLLLSTLATAKPLKILKTWSGRHNGSDSYQFVITSQKQWLDFIRGIPKKKITKMRPAPPSDDPLLKQPKINFKTHQVIVIMRDENMYVKSKVQTVTERKEDLLITVDHPKVGHTTYLNSVIGMGTYHASLIRKSKKPARFAQSHPSVSRKKKSRRKGVGIKKSFKKAPPTNGGKKGY